MGGFNNGEDGGKKTFASMKVIKEEKETVPYFIIKDKIDGVWKETDRYKNLDNIVPVDVVLDSYPWGNDIIDTVKLQLLNGQEKIQLEFNLDNSLSRNLLNSLLGESKIGLLNISLYVSKKGHPSIGIKNDGQKTTWKYPFEAFPVVEKTKKGAVIDNSEYLLFLKEMVKDLKVKLNKKPFQGTTITVSNATMRANENFDREGTTSTIGPEDDLPF